MASKNPYQSQLAGVVRKLDQTATAATPLTLEELRSGLLSIHGGSMKLRMLLAKMAASYPVAQIQAVWGLRKPCGAKWHQDIHEILYGNGRAQAIQPDRKRLRDFDGSDPAAQIAGRASNNSNNKKVNPNAARNLAANATIRANNTLNAPATANGNQNGQNALLPAAANLANANANTNNPIANHVNHASPAPANINNTLYHVQASITFNLDFYTNNAAAAYAIQDNMLPDLNNNAVAATAENIVSYVRNMAPQPNASFPHPMAYGFQGIAVVLVLYYKTRLQASVAAHKAYWHSRVQRSVNGEMLPAIVGSWAEWVASGNQGREVDVGRGCDLRHTARYAQDFAQLMELHALEAAQHQPI